MRIEIAQKFRPFSHTFGARCYIPWAGVVLKVYPTLLEFEGVGQIPLPLEWPLTHFTIRLDLERGVSSIFGENKKGYFSFPIEFDRANSCIKVGEHSLSFKSNLMPSAPRERLSFGCHKAQDWDKMRARGDLSEWLPHWHWMGQWSGDITKPTIGPLPVETLKELFEGNFSDYFVPEPGRSNLLGISSQFSFKSSPLVEGASLIRQMVVREDSQKQLYIVPDLQRTLVSGRYLNASLDWGRVDVEWSNGFIRRVIFKVEKIVSLNVHFQKEMKRCRLSNSLNSSKMQFKNQDMIELHPQVMYYFDKFEK